jgi:hypothetical protein
MTELSRVRLFGLSALSAERDLDKVEGKFKLDLQRGGLGEKEEQKDEEYYPQFAAALRAEASEMSRHYEVFYCLEKEVRRLIAERLEAQHGETWWTACVPPAIQENAKANMQKELESGVTPRSEDEIDYTTFGELGEIVRSNWDDFGGMFSNQKAFTKVMNSLNMLRGPIAHCSPLAEDEIVRLGLTVRDWFRLME